MSQELIGRIRSLNCTLYDAMEAADRIEELERQLADVRTKHEVACSTLEVVKGQRTAAQKALAAQCQAAQPKEAGQARELRSLIDLCERQIDADSRDCTTMQWHLTETPKRILAVLKAALASAPAQTVPEGWAQQAVKAMRSTVEKFDALPPNAATRFVTLGINGLREAIAAAAPVAQQGSKG